MTDNTQDASGAMSAPVPPVERSTGMVLEGLVVIAKYERIWGPR